MNRGLGHWDGIKYFKPDDRIDNWGDPYEVQRELLVELDAFRDFLGMPIIVLECIRRRDGKQQGGSQHYRGAAADIVVPAFQGTLLDLFFQASRFKFNGIGLYRDWHYQGQKTGGLHVDVRVAPHRALWFCYKNHKGVQEYVPLSDAMLRGYKVI